MREQSNPYGKRKKIAAKVWQILFIPLKTALDGMKVYMDE